MKIDAYVHLIVLNSDWRSRCPHRRCDESQRSSENAGLRPLGGPLICSDLLWCPHHCWDDADCDAACMTQGSAEGLALGLAFDGCIKEVCPDITDQPCALAAVDEGGPCYDDRMACNGDLPEGDLTCADLYSCVEGCAESFDLFCPEACVAQGTVGAQEAVLEVFKCIVIACGEDPPTSCWDEQIGAGGACQSLYEACGR